MDRKGMIYDLYEGEEVQCICTSINMDWTTWGEGTINVNEA